ncbi:hypothetical protein BCR41DRAFT_393803 [Lobosporangium transversale]|uniref:Uncharacterized protein n=1 Tax=Lobosporangium transversale TaxID=64571 RepID=A0A1Y2GUV9_9FUNG|nr:hypothetical protein BCR41DRAFT_393803 [Lobosporangium transversale]ORZ24839.1 hypothetical protein BCR41DRAFT_393803 [Lobosporangium transversale]|eukprot:XP_021883820.1 hypothetical protein BCR41DRAFT_393803 [Lobosporangium transversale]
MKLRVPSESAFVGNVDTIGEWSASPERITLLLRNFGLLDFAGSHENNDNSHRMDEDAEAPPPLPSKSKSPQMKHQLSIDFIEEISSYIPDYTPGTPMSPSSPVRHSPSGNKSHSFIRTPGSTTSEHEAGRSNDAAASLGTERRHPDSKPFDFEGYQLSQMYVLSTRKMEHRFLFKVFPKQKLFRHPAVVRAAAAADANAPPGHRRSYSHQKGIVRHAIENEIGAVKWCRLNCKDIVVPEIIGYAYYGHQVDIEAYLDMFGLMGFILMSYPLGGVLYAYDYRLQGSQQKDLYQCLAKIFHQMRKEPQNHAAGFALPNAAHKLGSQTQLAKTRSRFALIVEALDRINSPLQMQCQNPGTPSIPNTLASVTSISIADFIHSKLTTRQKPEKRSKDQNAPDTTQDRISDLLDITVSQSSDWASPYYPNIRLPASERLRRETIGLKPSFSQSSLMARSEVLDEDDSSSGMSDYEALGEQLVQNVPLRHCSTPTGNGSVSPLKRVSLSQASCSALRACKLALQAEPANKSRIRNIASRAALRVDTHIATPKSQHASVEEFDCSTGTIPQKSNFQSSSWFDHDPTIYCSYMAQQRSQAGQSGGGVSQIVYDPSTFSGLRPNPTSSPSAQSFSSSVLTSRELFRQLTMKGNSRVFEPTMRWMEEDCICWPTKFVYPTSPASGAPVSTDDTCLKPVAEYEQAQLLNALVALGRLDSFPGSVCRFPQAILRLLQRILCLAYDELLFSQSSLGVPPRRRVVTTALGIDGDQNWGAPGRQLRVFRPSESNSIFKGSCIVFTHGHMDPTSLITHPQTGALLAVINFEHAGFLPSYAEDFHKPFVMARHTMSFCNFEDYIATENSSCRDRRPWWKPLFSSSNKQKERHQQAALHSLKGSVLPWQPPSPRAVRDEQAIPMVKDQDINVIISPRLAQTASREYLQHWQKNNNKGSHICPSYSRHGQFPMPYPVINHYLRKYDPSAYKTVSYSEFSNLSSIISDPAMSRAKAATVVTSTNAPQHPQYPRSNSTMMHQSLLEGGNSGLWTSSAPAVAVWTRPQLQPHIRDTPSREPTSSVDESLNHNPTEYISSTNGAAGLNSAMEYRGTDTSEFACYKSVKDDVAVQHGTASPLSSLRFTTFKRTTARAMSAPSATVDDEGLSAFPSLVMEDMGLGKLVPRVAKVDQNGWSQFLDCYHAMDKDQGISEASSTFHATTMSSEFLNGSSSSKRSSIFSVSPVLTLKASQQNRYPRQCEREQSSKALEAFLSISMTLQNLVVVLEAGGIVVTPEQLLDAIARKRGQWYQEKLDARAQRSEVREPQPSQSHALDNDHSHDSIRLGTERSFGDQAEAVMVAAVDKSGQFEPSNVLLQHDPARINMESKEKGTKHARRRSAFKNLLLKVAHMTKSSASKDSNKLGMTTTTTRVTTAEATPMSLIHRTQRSMSVSPTFYRPTRTSEDNILYSAPGIQRDPLPSELPGHLFQRSSYGDTANDCFLIKGNDRGSDKANNRSSWMNEYSSPLSATSIVGLRLRTSAYGATNGADTKHDQEIIVPLAPNVPLGSMTTSPDTPIYGIQLSNQDRTKASAQIELERIHRAEQEFWKEMEGLCEPLGGMEEEEEEEDDYDKDHGDKYTDTCMDKNTNMNDTGEAEKQHKQKQRWYPGVAILDIHDLERNLEIVEKHVAMLEHQAATFYAELEQKNRACAVGSK